MGDTHFYNYGSDCTDVRIYPRSKFVSEFGTQSYPSFSVLRNVTAPSDWAYDSAMSNYRCGWRAPPCPATKSMLSCQPVPWVGHNGDTDR